MSHVTRICYGNQSELTVDLPDGQVLTRCGDPCGMALDDPRAAVAAALVEPVEFPPLVDATVPGDRVVLAVNPGVPQVGEVVGGVVQALVEGRLTGRDIRVLLPHNSSAADAVQAGLPSRVAREVRIDTHDPDRPEKLAYLAASKQGDPILVNRRICDADMVIPIGCLRPRDAWGASLGTLGVFPTFADGATARRFQSPAGWRGGNLVPEHAEDIREATWLLGQRFTVQVISAAGDQLLHVISGDVDAVAQRGGDLACSAWQCAVPGRARTVVAAIPGGADQQTWENVARTLFAASRVVDEHGAIVICSDLAERPGPALRRLIENDDLESTQQQLYQESSCDARFATQVADTLQSVRVYLISQLADELVEEMGMTPVQRPSEVNNLCRRMGDCLVLANAQHALPYVDGRLVPAR